MPPKKKGKGLSAEEKARIEREEQERLSFEEKLRQEKEAEERQRQENAKRDEEEAKERKRLKKEEQLRLLAEKEATIIRLTAELDAEKSRNVSERHELQAELERMLQLKDALLNEISALKSEAEETQRRLLEERAALLTDLSKTRSALDKSKADASSSEAALREENTTLGALADKAKKEYDALLKLKESNERDYISRTKNLEREMEKLTSLNKTLQEVIEAREADDRKNVTLMQLLNNQLDENKRRAQEILEEERQRCNAAKQEVVVLEARVEQLKEELEQVTREKDQIRRQSESDLHDYKEKLEQLKFDMKYLHSELHSYKSQCSKQQQETATVKAAAASETQNAKFEVETQLKKIEELETLARRKDREHYDKVTFLNAQIANNRTIISQLQQKLNREREERQAEIDSVSSELQAKTKAIQGLSSDLESRKAAAGDVEVKLNADIAILKTTVFQLQAALVDKEKELDVATATKDEEIRRLRRKLDEHFIPHRNEITPSADSSAPEVSVEQVLTEKVNKLTRELEVKNRASLETETRLKAQLTNQNHLIDSLQAELLKTKEESAEEIKVLQSENARLRQTLDVNFVPYKK